MEESLLSDINPLSIFSVTVVSQVLSQVNQADNSFDKFSSSGSLVLMNKELNVSVLSIGTELTTGQILNRNAAWIAEKCLNLGAKCNLHLTVPDNRSLILESLGICQSHSDLIFVTGGLGPTSDDFTRDVIAEWTGAKMKWDENSWEHLKQRMLPRGFEVKEIQKQQCYFPEGSQILTNRMGTANAFYLQHNQTEIFVLPGPPQEIQAVWEDWIQDLLKVRCQGLDAVVVRSWDTIGVGESIIAELVEKAIPDCPFEKAYRVHLPYVEFKLTHLKSETNRAKKWVDEISKALSPYVVLQDSQDIALLLGEQLIHYSDLTIEDNSSGGYLLKRVFPHLKDHLKKNQITLRNQILTKDSPIGLQLSLDCSQGNGALEAKVTLSYLQIKEELNLTNPFKTELMNERCHQYFAEKALIFFYQFLSRVKIV